jgi:hypothetical protein
MVSDERPGSRGRARRGSDDDIGPDVGLEALRPAPAAEGTGAALVRADEVGTVAFVVAATAAALAPGVATAVLVGVSLLGLAVGMGAFLWAYAMAIGRSRTDAIGMGGLFFLAGSAPAGVRRRFTVLLVVQVVVAVAAASVRPFTPLAFGVLFPMYGLGLAGLWGARHGVFPPRVVKGRRRGDGSAEGTGRSAAAGDE